MNFNEYRDRVIWWLGQYTYSGELPRDRELLEAWNAQTSAKKFALTYSRRGRKR